MKKGNRGQRSSTTSSKSRESTQTPPLDLFITVPAQCDVIVAVYQHSYAFSRRESVNLFSVFVDVGQRNVEAEKGETVLKHVLFVVGRFFGRDKFPVEIFASCIGIGVDISTIGVGDRCRWIIY